MLSYACYCVSHGVMICELVAGHHGQEHAKERFDARYEANIHTRDRGARTS